MNCLQHRTLSATAALILASTALAQDDCGTASPISGTGSFPYDTTGFSSSGFDGGGLCAASIGQDHFFEWTATTTGAHTFDTCGTAYDTVISIHAGADCGASCIATNDDSACGLQSTLVVTGIVAGDVLLLQLGGFGSSEGPAAVNIALASPPPPNDTCLSGTPISGQGTFPWDNSSATTSGFSEGACGAGLGSPAHNDVFLVWTATTSGDFLLDTCLSGTDSVINVYSGGDCTATCVDDSGDNDACGDDDSINLIGVAAGDVFLIQVGGWFSTTSTVAGGILTIGPGVSGPANDDCSTPTAISGFGTHSFDSTAATVSGFDGNGLAPCLGVAMNRDLFWVWTATTPGPTQFDNIGTGFDSRLSLHQGSDCTATCVANDNNGGGGVNEKIVITVAAAGEVYLVQNGGWGAGDAGSGVLNISTTSPPPANDTCATPTPISGTGTFAFDNTAATGSGFDGGGAPCVTTVASDVFHVWTAPGSGPFDIETCGSGFDTRLQVHLGADCSATCFDESDDLCGLESRVQVFALAAGQTFLLQTGGFSAVNTGVGTLTISVGVPPPPPPANNTCGTPDVALEGTTVWDNEFATTSGFDGGNAALCMSPANGDTTPLGQCHKDLFWVFTTPCDGDWQIDTENSTINDDTRLNIHLGNDCSAVCLQSDDDSGAVPDFSSLSVIPSTKAGTDFLIQVGSWSDTSAAGAGVLNITQVSGGCPGEITIVCDPANPHYAGGSCTLATSFLGAATPSGLKLEATGGPPNEFGFFLISGTATSSISAFNGVLCLDAPSARYNSQVAINQGLPQLNSVGQFDSAGVLQNLVGTGTSTGGTGFDVPLELPYTPAGALIQSGETWCFQLWFRDQVPPLPNPGSSANFSNVAQVEFP